MGGEIGLDRSIDEIEVIRAANRRAPDHGDACGFQPIEGGERGRIIAAIVVHNDHDFVLHRSQTGDAPLQHPSAIIGNQKGRDRSHCTSKPNMWRASSQIAAG